jgi:hypothetical protein
MNSKLRGATFDFETHRVFFCGGLIGVYAAERGQWELVHEMANPWESQISREGNGVMCRRWKPRVTDAQRILTIARREIARLETSTEKVGA